MAEQQIKVCEMDTSSPIDIELAIRGLGGEPQIFYMMLGSLEDMTLVPTMKSIIVPFEQNNFQEMKDWAHGLKGASGYIGASRLHYVCFFMKEHFLF